MDLSEIAEEIRTQDNLATSDPFFILYDIEEIPSHEDYTSDYVYHSNRGDGEFGYSKEEVIEFLKDNEWELPENVDNIDQYDFDSWIDEHPDIDKCYYIEKPRLQGVFFTKKSAELHMKANNYHYNKPYVYCVSLWRNPEMNTIRKALIENRFIEIGENIKATWTHDSGAYGRCSYCGRYSDNPKILSQDISCDCGKKTGWSGSFIKPTPESKWSKINNG